MGCATSKVNDLPAVALCRDRCHFLQKALRQSYALADAHVAYMHSLKALGPTLHLFVDHHHCSSNGEPSKSSHSAFSPEHSHSSSNSDSHLHFDSDSEEEHGDKKFESFHQIHSNYHNHEIQNPLPDMFTSINYTKNQPTQSVSYSYPNHNHDTNYFTHNGELEDLNHSSASRTPPPPAPRSSTWDFLNFFETYERYELPFVIGKESKEKEGNFEDGFSAKEVRGDLTRVGAEENRTGPTVSAENRNAVDKNVNKEKKRVKEKSNLVEEKNQGGKRVEYDVMRELQAMFDRASDSGNEVLKMLDTTKFRSHQKNSANLVSSKLLHVVSPPLTVASSQHSNSKSTGSSSSTEKTGSVHLGFDDDVGVTWRNLSSTLMKLCMWEKKLHDEVKAEEKMRIIHAKKSRQLKSLDENTAEAHKVDSTRALVRTLSTKMIIAIQVIDKMSITINKLRDEELWPQINELIHGLLRMWKVMLECHRRQLQTIVEAKSLDTIAFNGKLNNVQLEAAIQLKFELQSCNLSFFNWMEAQKGYVNALNGWLVRCLLHEPEETSDGMAPFSPGRIGAPVVFVIVNQWSQAMDRLSEKEVIGAMHGFVTTVNQLLEQHNVDLQQRVNADKDMDRKMKILTRQEQKIVKVMQAREKKMVLLPGERSDVFSPGGTAHGNEITNTTSLQSGLKQIFMAMEKFASNSMDAYEELDIHIEEGRLTREKSGDS